MNEDGDILGTRRRPESGAADSNSVLAAPSSQRSRHLSAIAGSPLKRQRSMGIGAVRGEPEETVGGSSAGVVPVDQLTPLQMKRYRAWKRSRLERSCIRELILDRAAPTLTQAVEAGQGNGSVRETTVIAVAAVAKMFVGDLIEEAKRAQINRGEEGPLRPMDLLDARERLANDGRGPPLQPSSVTQDRVIGGISVGRAEGSRLLEGYSRLVEGDAI